MNWLKVSFIIFVFVFTFTHNCYAEYQDVGAILKVGIGSEKNQISIYEGYPENSVTGDYLVKTDGKVVVSDGLDIKLFAGELNSFFSLKLTPNFTAQVFLTPLSVFAVGSDWGSDGTFLNNIYEYDYDGYLKSTLLQKNYNGDFLEITSEAKILTALEGLHYEYSSTGELLASYNGLPSKFGEISYKHESTGYITNVKFNDIEYAINGYIKDYVRDQNNYIYSWQIYTAIDPISKTDSIASKVWKYGPCGKPIGTLVLPTTEYEPVTEEEMENGAGVDWIVRNQYGPPVIGPDGSIYAYKRTPDTYSILKWQWVDDPSDPKPGPDSSPTTRAIPLTTGIHMTWERSPQDPGCVQEYDIERSTTADGIYELLTTVEKGTTSYDDEATASGETWYYRVKAKAGELESDYSPITSATRE